MAKKTDESEESKVAEKKSDNPVTLDITVDGRHYQGAVEFERFTFHAWRRWRKTVRNKQFTKSLEKIGYDTDEQAEVVSYWSGAAVLKNWNIYYDVIEGREKGTHAEIPQPVPGEEPDENIDYVVFQWFRRVANEYLLPRLGMFPNS